MLKILIKRKEKEGVNIEFTIQNHNAFGDKKYYGISQVPSTKSSEDIIGDIENEIDYYTKDYDNKEDVPVVVEGGTDKVEKYLSSKANEESDDNIDKLETYE